VNVVCFEGVFALPFVEIILLHDRVVCRIRPLALRSRFLLILQFLHGGAPAQRLGCHNQPLFEDILMTLVVLQRFRIDLDNEAENGVNVLVQLREIHDVTFSRLLLKEHGYDVYLRLLEVSLLERLY
jgi:hypothetical protein